MQTQDANKYFKDGVYIFPFDVLDTTGRGLGRIEWRIEPVKSRRRRGGYNIEKLLVWTAQTADVRYKGILFEIPCDADWMGRSSKNDYMSFVHRTAFCDVHKTLYFSAYPEDRHKYLKISPAGIVLVYFSE